MRVYVFDDPVRWDHKQVVKDGKKVGQLILREGHVDLFIQRYEDDVIHMTRHDNLEKAYDHAIEFLH